jgi:hypothetical protein
MKFMKGVKVMKKSLMSFIVFSDLSFGWSLELSRR